MKFYWSLVLVLLVSALPQKANSHLPILEQIVCSNDLPTKPIKKKKNKTIKRSLKVKQEQRLIRQKVRKAKRKSKKKITAVFPPKTKERKDWNIWLTLGLFNLGVLIVSPIFLSYALSISFGLALGGGPEIWSILFLILAIILAIAIILGFILGIIFTIKGLVKLKKEGKPTEHKFDRALFWGIMSTILIPIIFTSLIILFFALSPGTVLTWVIMGIVIAFFAAAIIGLFVSLRKLRNRALQSDEF
jgi:hypothetical protein